MPDVTFFQSFEGETGVEGAKTPGFGVKARRQLRAKLKNEHCLAVHHMMGSLTSIIIGKDLC